MNRSEITKMVWIQRTEKEMVENIDKTKCQKLGRKTSFILNRLQGLIGLPVMTSLKDNGIHHPFWAEFREGRGYKDRLKKSQKDSE